MKPFKWLVPIDGSELSIEALAHALTLARSGLSTEVVLVNVQEPATVYEMVTLHDRDALERVAQATGADVLAPALELARAAQVPATPRVLVGDPVPMLLEALEAEGCQAIIMGSQGKGLVSQTLLGSVSQALLAKSPVPITFVTPGPEAG
jgi:nucleotide-binding universal stress UspA family protein